MSLSNNIWITRKARINASERLKRNDEYSQFLLIYYSFFIIVISILDMQNPTNSYEVFTLILSILILLTSIYISAKNFKERALRLQAAYIKMGRIYRDVLDAEAQNVSIKSLETEYDSLLDVTENHNSCDYLNVLYAVKNEEGYNNPTFTWSKYISLFFCKICTLFLVSILFLLPYISLFLINI